MALPTFELVWGDYDEILDLIFAKYPPYTLETFTIPEGYNIYKGALSERDC